MLRLLAGALATFMTLVACSGSPAGTTVPGATTATATQAPAIGTTPPDQPPGQPNASLVPDLPLEALFPDDVGGQTLTVQSASGQSVRDLFPGDNDDSAELDALLTRLGTTIDNVSAAFTFSFGPGATETEFQGISIFAMRVRNVPATNLVSTFVEVSQEEAPGSEVGTATIGGKAVTTLTDPESPDETAYFYPVGDVLFFMGGTPALVEEALAELP